MSEKVVAQGHLTRILAVMAGAMAILYATETVVLRFGYEPFLFCAANNMLDVLGVKGWYAFITYSACILAVVDGATRGLQHSIRWLCLVVLLCSIPTWLEQGFSHGRSCDVPPRVLPPAPLVGDPPAFQR